MNPRQKEVVESRADDLLLIVAGAGSGKTLTSLGPIGIIYSIGV